MTMTVKTYSNGDHVAVAWIPDDEAAIPDCRGFTVKRSLAGAEKYLHSFVGFNETDAFPSEEPWRWPLQRYLWWDYGVRPGDRVKYQVIPVTGPAQSLQLRDDLASDWTDELLVTSQFSPHVSAYFNKGVVAAQWVSRALDAEAPGETRRNALKDLITKVGDPLREALGALLKPAVIDTIENAGAGSLYAALYELNDPELLTQLEDLGAKANIVLGNGAFSAAEPDENAKVREDLKKTTVNVFDRIVAQGHFAHNKFAVSCDAAGQAQAVLTGSTNWTSTGLCSQANNGLVIADHDVADRFLTQWNRLKAAGNGFPGDLIAQNSELEQFTVDGMTITPWFVPTSHEQDLVYARERIAQAQQAIFFLFFNPGIYQEDPERETLLQNILERRDTDLYIRGVVNQEIKNLTEDAPAERPPVTLVDEADKTPLSSAVLVPANIKEKFANWEDEVLGASPVMVHSKIIVLDPWGEHPVLMTGSHNLGFKASKKNDDNLVILEGPAASAVATAYAVNIIAIYQAYRWNKYVTDHARDPNVWHGLQDTADWQGGHLQGQALAELRFWTQAPAVTTTTTPTATH
jgi:phosphatidylserine/phosphatidylglycerophosphate/cardiolipin synthase-like enzyme